MKTRIHVNQHNIKRNAANPFGMLPVFTVKTYKSNIRCNEVTIDGPSKLVYAPARPLPCGARCWIETNAPVRTDRDDAGSQRGPEPDFSTARECYYPAD